ncbi:amidohydrolase, partial [SAR202 cluster bacterium AD-802-E10_MRT_200m]|nr:amidohydrolase [SAR202 cluster bacterium AD-802-E10_MRT_200m]
DVSVVVGIGWQNFELAHSYNEYILDAQSRFPNRIVGFCAVNPGWGELALIEAARCFEFGLKGIGELHPDTQGFNLSDFTLINPLMELIMQFDVPILVHSSEPMGHNYAGKGTVHPATLIAFIQKFKDAQIICAHWGGGLPFYALMPEIAHSLKNVYFDSAASPFLYDSAIFSVVTQLVGPDKVLFGSDFPLVRQNKILNQVQDNDFSPETLALILGGNAHRLLKL